MQSGTVLQNRYRIVKQLNATTYRAWDTALDQPRILQVVPATGDRPKQLAQLHHTHLPRVSDVLVEGEQRLLVVDFVDGQSVSERVLERGRPVELARARHWANQIGDALRYLHQQGMTHGGVSAENIQITPTQDAILTGYSAESHPQRDDVRGLAHALYTMVTAQPVSDTSPAQHNSKLPSVLSAAIMNGVAGKYSTVDDLLTALDQPPEPARPVPSADLPETTPLNIPRPASSELAQTTPLNIARSPVGDKTTPYQGAPPTPFAPSTAAQPAKKRSLLPLIGGLVALLLGAFVVFSLLSGGDDEPSEPTAVVADAEVPTDQPAVPTESVNEPTAIPTIAPISGRTDEDEPAATPVPEADDPEPTSAPADSVVTIGDAQFQQLFSGASGLDAAQIGTLGGLALDEATGTLYVADTNSGLLTINVVTGETQTVDFGLPFATIDHVNIVDPTTLVLFSGIGNTGFLVDIASQQLRGTFGSDGTGEDQFRLVKSIANSADGTLYIFDTSQDADGNFVDFIKVFAADGTFQRAIPAGENAVGALAIDAQDNLYVDSFSSILKLDNDGNLIEEISAQALADAHPDQFQSATITAMTVAVDGSLIVTTRNAGILVLDAQGNLIAQFGEPFEECRDADTLNAGQICDPEAVVVSSDGATILYTDNTYNFGAVTAVEIGR